MPEPAANSDATSDTTLVSNPTMLTTLPLDILLDIFDDLDIKNLDGIGEGTLLALRLTCRSLSQIATDYCKHRLRFRARSAARMKEFIESHKRNDPWTACFSTVVFKSSWILSPEHAKIRVHTTRFLLNAVDFLEAVGKQFTGLQLETTAPEEVLDRLPWEVRDQLQDMFFRAMTMLLFHASNENEHIPNVRRLSIVMGNQYHLSNLAFFCLDPADCTILRWRKKETIKSRDLDSMFKCFQRYNEIFDQNRSHNWGAQIQPSIFPWPEPIAAFTKLDELRIKTTQIHAPIDALRAEINAFALSLRKVQKEKGGMRITLIQRNANFEHWYGLVGGGTWKGQGTRHVFSNALEKDKTWESPNAKKKPLKIIPYKPEFKVKYKGRYAF